MGQGTAESDPGAPRPGPQYEHGVDSFTKANSIQRHDVTFMQLGKVYALQEDYKSAIDVYTEARHTAPPLNG